MGAHDTKSKPMKFVHSSNIIGWVKGQHLNSKGNLQLHSLAC